MVQAGGYGASGEFVGRDLALAGEILIPGRSLERLEKMTKQRLAELKLSDRGNVGHRGMVPFPSPLTSIGPTEGKR